MPKATVAIYDGSGSQIDEIPYGQNGITGTETDAGRQRIYVGKDANGNSFYTTDLYQADYSSAITMDKDTGKITISAPQELLDDPSFKEVFDPDILKQFSSAYQRNPDYKLADPFDETDEAKDITIPELIEKYNSQVKDFVAALQQENQTRNDIASGKQGFSNRNDIANRLTRSDMIIMGTNALGEGANDQSLIAIPKFLYKDILDSKAETFDSESGTIKKGDFRKNVYSLIEKDEDFINSMYNRLEEYFEENDFEDTDEYARATALYSFLINNDPDMTPGQVANYVTSSLFKGMGISARSSLVGLANLAASLPFFSAAGGLGTGPVSKNAIRQFTEAGLEDIEKEREEAQDFLNRMSSAGKIALDVGSFGETLAEVIASAGLAGAAAKSATIAKMVSKAAKGAEAAESISKVAMTVASSAEELATGADLLVAANTASKAAEMGAIAARATAAANTTRVVSTAADLAAQSIVEAVVYDPVVFAKILQNQETNGIQAATYDDAYGMLLETAAWNIGGWGAFSATAKGVKNIGKTKVGRYTNAVAQKVINKVPVYTGSLGEKILRLRYGDEWLNGSRSPRKNEARKYNYEIRQAQEVVASQKIGFPFSKDVGKNVRQQEQNIIKMTALHNATDALQRGANAYIRRSLNGKINPKLSGYEQKLRELGANITKAERAAGLSTRRKIFRREDTGTVRVFSRESANYIGARTQLDVLKNIKRRVGLTQAQEEGEEILKKMLKDSKAKLPKKIQESLEEYLSWDRKFWQEYNNMRMAEGSLNAKQIEDLRAEGYWGRNGELYRPSYRVDPDKETKLVRNDERVARDNDTATEQYVWGSKKDFMDPEVARYMAMSNAGATLNAAKYVEAVNAIPSSKAHVVHDAEEVARAQRMKNIRTPLNKRIQDVTRTIFETGSIATGFSASRTVELSKMRREWVKQSGKVESAKLSLGRADTKKIRLRVTDKRAAVDAMTQDQLDDVFTEAGITFDFNRMGSAEEFETFYNSLDKTTQKYVQQKMGSVAGVLYPADTGVSALDRAIAKSSRASSKASKLSEEKSAAEDSIDFFRNDEGEIDFSLSEATKAQRIKDEGDASITAYKDWHARREELLAIARDESFEAYDKALEEGMSKAKAGARYSAVYKEKAKEVDKIVGPEPKSPDYDNLLGYDTFLKGGYATDGKPTISFSDMQNLTRGDVRRALYEDGFDNIVDKEIKADIAKADDAFTQRLENDMVLYRGETKSRKKIKKGEDLDSSSYTYLGATKTYTDPYRKGMTTKLPTLTGGVLYRYHLPKGQPVYHNPDTRMFEEFILPRDVKATVVGVQKDAKGYFSPKKNPVTIVDVEVDSTTGVTPNLQPQKTSNLESASNLESVSTSDTPLLVKNAPYITAENYNKLARLDPSFTPNLKKSLAKNRVDLRDSKAVIKATDEGRRAELVAEREGLYRENLEELNRLTKEGLDANNEEKILAEFDNAVDDYLDVIYDDKKITRTIDDIIDQSGTVDKEAAREYIALEEIVRDDSQALKEIRKVSRKEFEGNPEAVKADELFERMFMDKIYERRNIARQKLADEQSALVDRKSWMEEIRKIDKDITGKLSEPGYISLPNAKGEMEIWEVDPIAADLYKYAARRPDMNMAEKFFNETSKIFRLGTTGMNLLSFVNQSFRDFGNLWLTSGSYHMINLSRADMVNLFGPEIATHYLREEPEIYKQLVELAKKRGKTIEETVIERELQIGRETSTQATETALLKTVGDAGAIRKISAGETSRLSQNIDRVVDKLSTPNELRERYFRNVVYADSLDQALRRGYSLKDARIQAEFMMNNATTNFSRELVHLQALQRTVPYIGAAVNGTKSFFRVLSVDPVGVMSRFVGGFVVPVMAFTGIALADPEARKKYEQLSEYEKDNNIIIPINGALMKIPIPQEVGPLVKPWQHLVEKMYGSNRHDFWELMLNDALGISPMDITGFYDLDQDAMENPSIWDRLDNGATQLVWGQLVPPPVKSAYMLATGKDPYTGKFIDTSYQYYDYDSGEVVTMDSSTSAFAQAMANTFGGPASVIAAATNAVLGRSWMDVLDSMTSALQYVGSGGEEGSLTTIFERAGEEISKPITVADYDRTKTAWNREISRLYRKKTEIQNNPKYKEIEEAINKETDPTKLKKLKAQREDMLEDWYEETKVAINKLQDNFGGTIDRYRMASLISLLNMHESTGGTTPVGRGANEELYYEGRDEAIRALIDMGASSTGDASILGYVTRVKQDDGSETTEVKFYKPLEILAMQNAWYNNASVSASYIEELLEDGPVDYKARKKAIKQQIDAIYAKGKLSQSDYNAINAIKINWNSEVMQAIAPYIERVSPESAINDDEVIQYLKQFIYVPDDIKVDKRGYHVTNKSLAGGSANEAYIKKFLQSAYGINDTGYSGGVNYSGRQTLGGE